ncbi:Mitotic checkpoint regulator, MAD2B-interacting domain containing protein [Naviculisporaceae sp. PSN 640]
MGLVDYSDSDSDSEVVQKPSAPPLNSATGKKPFQKLVDRGSGKIVVNLTSTASADATSTNDEPPAKRARTTGSGSSRFSNFGSFLPPPKKTAPVLGKSIAASTSRTGGTAPAPGVHLKTGAEPAFSRSADITEEADGDAYNNDGGSGSSIFGSGLNLPPPKGSSSSGPTIPAGQKPAEEVKLVGKPLMFKPLSVSRKPAQQKKKKDGSKAVPSPNAQAATSKPAANFTEEPAPPPKKKVSLFSLGGEDETTSSTAAAAAETTTTSDGTYEPLFSGIPEAEDTGELTNGEDGEYYENSSYNAYANQSYVSSNNHEPNTLNSIADSLSLSKAARRDLFGRNGPPATSSSSNMNQARIVNFSMEKEYAHNEALRQSGALADQVHNPVRSIAPGKHSLRQMVNMAQNNQAALEDSFAAGRNNRRDAAGKYGWK